MKHLSAGFPPKIPETSPLTLFALQMKHLSAAYSPKPQREETNLANPS